MELNNKNKSEGLKFLNNLDSSKYPIIFFDPQYKNEINKIKFNNKTIILPQMDNKIIDKFIKEINRILKPSGHLFLWVNKYVLCNGIKNWLYKTELEIVDLITWNKLKIDIGHRTNQSCKYLYIIQKIPKKTKGIWKNHSIRDIWDEKVEKTHIHNKPIELQKTIIEAVTEEEDIVIDPASGSYSILKACQLCNRNFLGCDIIE